MFWTTKRRFVAFLVCCYVLIAAQRAAMPRLFAPHRVVLHGDGIDEVGRELTPAEAIAVSDAAGRVMAPVPVLQIALLILLLRRPRS